MMFVGSTKTHAWIDRLIAHGWGRLFAEEKPVPRPGEPWALDNGVFGASKRGEAWSPDKFLRSLEQAKSVHAPTVAVLPDIVGGGLESLAHSMRWLADLPAHLPWYIAVQDGMTLESVAEVLPSVAGIFLGGSDRFKGTAPAWCELAHAHGKRFHYARVSTRNRLLAALDCGADSADSAQMLWSQEHFARFERWWRDAHAQLSLFGKVTPCLIGER